MTTMAAPICLGCKHYDRTNEDFFLCAAFPDGVPYEIITSEHDHTHPYPGDHGIQFEPIDETEPTEEPA